MSYQKSKSRNEQMRRSIERGIPFWLDASAYPDWAKLSTDQRRWEFLRRTEDYHKSWRDCVEDPLVTVPSASKWNGGFKQLGTNPLDVARKYRMNQLVSPKLSYRELPDGFEFSVPNIVGGKIIYPDTPCPFTQEYDAYRKTLEKPKNKYEELHVKGVNDISPPYDWYQGTIWIEFDLQSDPELQIDEARKNLKSAISNFNNFMMELEPLNDEKLNPDAYFPHDIWKAKGRTEKDSYMVSVLRIWDASFCGATDSDISSELCIIESGLSADAVSKRRSKAMDMWRRL